MSDDIIAVRCRLKKWKDYAVIVPVTQSDVLNLSAYTEKAEDQFLTVTIKQSKASKTYSQLKTAWALVTILFQSEYGRKPTDKERKKYHLELLNEFADDTMREPGLRDPSILEPITFSEMSEQQLSNFISILIQLLSEALNLTMSDQLQAQQVFQEWQNFMSTQDRDWNDYDSDGHLLDIDTWREQHPLSFATGKGGPLDLAHIVTRGADPKDKYNCWNVMMLTHEEHMKQHEIGWTEFVKLYPHLKGRVQRAERLSGHRLLLED